MSRLADTHFGRYQTLHACVQLTCTQSIETQKKAALERISKQLDSERDPFTLDPRFLETISKQRIQKQDQNTSDQNSRHGHKNEEDCVSWTSEIKNGVGVELSCALFAFYEISVSRFIDQICMIVTSELSTTLCKSLTPQLMGQQWGSSELQQFFSVSEEESQRRTTLNASLLRLEKIADELSASRILRK